MTARCIELTAVYDDGTVERWEGDAADRAMSEFESGATCTVEEMCCTRSEIASVEANIKPQAVTHPARKVTALRGHPSANGYCIARADGGGKAVDLPDLLPAPPLAMFDSGMEFDFRITVESVPVVVKP